MFARFSGGFRPSVRRNRRGGARRARRRRRRGGLNPSTDTDGVTPTRHTAPCGPVARSKLKRTRARTGTPCQAIAIQFLSAVSYVKRARAF